MTDFLPTFHDRFSTYISWQIFYLRFMTDFLPTFHDRFSYLVYYEARQFAGLQLSKIGPTRKDTNVCSNNSLPLFLNFSSWHNLRCSQDYFRVMWLPELTQVTSVSWAESILISYQKNSNQNVNCVSVNDSISECHAIHYMEVLLTLGQSFSIFRLTDQPTPSFPQKFVNLLIK